MTTHRSLFKSLALAAVAASAAFIGTSAFADDPTPDHSASVLSQKSRAQVASELAQAQRDGSTKYWSNPYYNKWLGQAKSVKSRSEVNAEVVAARASGELNAFVGESSGSFYLARTAPRRARSASAE